MNKNGKTAAGVTIGCRLNQADTALLYDRLSKAGYEIVSIDSKNIDVVIVNSCTVTANAAQKSRQAVRRMRRKHPEACIVLAGCSAKIEAEFWEGEDVADVILTNEDKRAAVEAIDEFFERGRKVIPRKEISTDATFKEDAQGVFPFKSRAFLKIQEGCESFCSYCIVPYARGKERSRDWDETVCEFKKFLKEGFREIVLTGVNICAYNDSGRGLPELLEEFGKIPGDFRIRLSSTEPHPCNMALLDLMEKYPEKICRFLHLPLQHGADEILKAMNRKYTLADYRTFVAEARKRVPGIHLGSDVIVGFPGETDSLFKSMCDFIDEMSFANLHIFTYSKREGTPAVDFPGHVDPQTAKARYDRLSEIAEVSAEKFAVQNTDSTLKVLLEKKISGNEFEGWSDNYLRVRAKGENLAPNIFCKVKVNAVDSSRVLQGDAVS